MNASLQSDPSAIAITGIAGRFPGAQTLSAFWNNLRDGAESISPLTDGQLLAAGVDPALLRDPHYVKAASVLDGIDLFDASFFGLSPRDAAIMDPQHRVFLECAWHALEDAGWSVDAFPGRIGVYAGSGMNAYLLFNLLPNRALMESAGLFLLKQTGNDKDVLATRVSYQMNLTGPSLTVQTACSTSLVAVHLACQSLISHECDMALAGGVTIEIPHQTGYLYREGEILSRDGHCRAFDASSSGTVFGSGAGVVVLRRLADALASGDNIQAVIRGTAINNDGARKVGYLAPSVSGQSDVVLEALAVAGVDAESISYIETHGTGTSLGDPIEVAALTQAFRKSTQKRSFCRIGSLKTNIGHLDAAAGVAGLIKTVLSLQHKQVPPSLHFSKPNPAIDFESSPFLVNDRLSAWDTDRTPRRAGVTSLGIGGTNAHAIIEEAQPPEASAPSRAWQILTLSAKTPRALEAAAANFADHLAARPDLNLADAAYTCHLGRKEFNHHRRAVLCRTLEDAVQSLRAEAHDNEANPAPVAFLFPGQGSQYFNMARGLYDTEPEFRSQTDLCADFLQPRLGLDLRTVLFTTGEQLDQTWLTQAALFVIEWALAKLWMSWGICPAAMIGHSIGEFTAAALAGVFSLEDALIAVSGRGRLMQAAPPGAMLAARLSENDALPFATGPISLAAVNGPRQCVLSGPLDAIAELERQLVENKITYRRLQTSHGFHSAAMDQAAGEFEALMRGISLKPPEIPFISNVSGDWIKPEEATDPAYWALQMRKTVHFYRGFRVLSEHFSAFSALECGPGRVLSGLTGSLGGDDPETVLGTLGRLWAAGAKVDWTGFHAHERRQRVSLPGYPFERQRFWIDAPKPAPVAEAKPEPWYYKPVWKRLPPLPAPKDESGIEAEIAAVLREGSGEAVAADARRIFVLNPSFDKLLSLAQGLQGEVDLCLISNGLQSVNGEPVQHPEQALLLGPGKVIPKEFPNIRCKCIDVVLEPDELPRIARQIVAEMASPGNQIIAYRGEDRWEQTLERTALEPARNGSRLRPRGIYMITGGLGGVGLAITEYLAREFKAKLVLMGRREPGEAARKKIRDLEALGAEVLAVRGDVTSVADLRRAIGEAKQRFGTIHGVVHAAGVLDDGVIQLKTLESARRVLAPKIQGTLALTEALEGIPLDFLVLFSSISSFTAPAGQVDYVAANSFLDAFAHASRAENKTWAVAINWPKWRNVGMAARKAAPRTVDSTSHPLLGRCTVDSADTLVYENSLSCDDLWVLNEHRLRGAEALFPGTGYIELARAAMQRRFGKGAIELQDLAFQAPLSVESGAARPIRVKLAKNGHGDAFAFSTVLDPPAFEHDASPAIASATARVRYLGHATPEPRNPEELLSRCNVRKLSFGTEAQNPKQAQFIDFGPRWRCLQEARLGNGEAVTTLELPEKFSGDLETFASHPALLDAATGSAILTIPDYESTRNLYIPVSYKSITLYSALPRKCYCHIRGKASNSIEGESVAFDLALMDENGRTAAEIEEFVLMRLSGTWALSPPRQNAVASEAAVSGDGSIEPAMGVEAFAAILASDAPPQIVVTPPDWTFEPPETEPGRPTRRAADSISGEDLSSDAIESMLTAWWKELLGVENIGLRDSFFDLGGHSLIGLRLLAKIEKEFRQSIPLHALFESSTIESLAARIRRARPAQPSTVAALNSDGASPGFYCVHSLGGEVASFRHLAGRLNGVRKFYGIQTPPEMQTPEFAASIEAMAAHYVKELLAFQPEGPFLLGGWSAGSTIALEMARQLRADGRTVELVVALDGAPFNTGTGTPKSNPLYYWKLLRNLPLWVADDLLVNFSISSLFRRARNKASAFARRKAARFRGGAAAREFEVSSFMDTGHYSARQVSFMNAMFAALQRYVPRPYPGRILVYQARTEPLHHLFEIDRAWREIASDVRVVRAPGSHLSLIAEPNVRAIAEDLRRVLAQE